MRSDIGIVLITQDYAEKVRHIIDSHTAAIPTILEIPSKENPYDPEKDSILIRARYDSYFYVLFYIFITYFITNCIMLTSFSRRVVGGEM